MPFLDRQDRVATVKATEQTTLLRMTASNFDTVMREIPSIAPHLLAIVSRRLRDVEERYVAPTQGVVRT
jgi:CRP-like cAMP-binding protein